MISKYIHLNDDDLIENQLLMAGIKKEEVLQKSELIKPDASIVDKLQESNKQQAAELAEMKEHMAEMEQILNDPSVIESMIEKRVAEMLNTKT